MCRCVLRCDFEFGCECACACVSGVRAFFVDFVRQEETNECTFELYVRLFREDAENRL